MGLAALRRILDPQPCALGDFSGTTVAVDADNLLWSFETAMAARGAPPTGPDGTSIAHVIGLVNRLKLYAEHGIRSAWVFDGAQPALKDATLAARWERIDAARAAGGSAQAQVALTSAQRQDARDLLTALGVPWLTAPGESDPQCAALARAGTVDAAVTQDYDAALHGSPLTVRNLTASRTRRPECIRLADALAVHGFTRAELVDAAILMGTDYNAGVKGVGPVKALKLVKSEGDVHGALAKLGEAMPDVDAVRALFLAHPVDAAWTPRFAAPDADAVTAFLAARGLSAERARTITDAVAALHAKA